MSRDSTVDEKSKADRDLDERVSLHGPEYEAAVRALLDVPRKPRQSTKTDAEGSEGDAK